MLATLVPVLVGIAVPLASFATGLRATDPLWLWKRPQLLARSLLAILVIVPVVEVLLAGLLSPSDMFLRAGIVVSILAIGLGPPALMQHSDDPQEVACYEIGLNVVLMIFAIFYVPMAVAIHGALYHHDVSLPWPSVARVVLIKALLPFAAGVACARWLPKVTAPLEKYAPKTVIAAMLIVALVAVLAMWRSLLAIGVGAWVACLVVAIVAVLIGHFAGGGTRETNAVLAEFSAVRFPALALLLVSVIPKGKTLVPFVLAYAIASTLVVSVYRAAMRKRAAEDVEANA